MIHNTVHLCFAQRQGSDLSQYKVTKTNKQTKKPRDTISEYVLYITKIIKMKFLLQCLKVQFTIEFKRKSKGE